MNKKFGEFMFVEYRPFKNEVFVIPIFILIICAFAYNFDLNLASINIFLILLMEILLIVALFFRSWIKIILIDEGIQICIWNKIKIIKWKTLNYAYYDVDYSKRRWLILSKCELNRKEIKKRIYFECGLTLYKNNIFVIPISYKYDEITSIIEVIKDRYNLDYVEWNKSGMWL